MRINEDSEMVRRYAKSLLKEAGISPVNRQNRKIMSRSNFRDEPAPELEDPTAGMSEDQALRSDAQTDPVAIDIYLRREDGFREKKKDLYYRLANAISKLGFKVRPFSDTLANGSSVLELEVNTQTEDEKSEFFANDLDELIGKFTSSNYDTY